MKVALYIRVSTWEQVEHGYSMDEQESLLKEHCEKNELTIFKYYREDGHSAGSLDRPALQKLIKDAERKKFNAVLVTNLDRLSRNQKNTLYLIEDIFDKNGIQFISINEPYYNTSTDYMRDFLIGTFSNIAQMERAQITERMKMGKLGRAKSGKPMAWTKNMIPLGYDYSEGEYIVNEFEASVVKEVFETYLKERSVNKTVQLLNQNGHIGKDVPWSSKTLRDVLINPTYIGKIKFKGKVYDGNHTPIISEKDFNEVKKWLDAGRRNAFNPRPFEAKYMLSGLIRCGECGSPMMAMLGSIRLDGTRKRYYRCKSFKKSKGAGKHYYHIDCNSVSHDMVPLEDEVIERITYLQLHPDALKGTEKEDNSDKIKLMENEIVKLNEQLEKLLDLYLTNDMPLDLLNSRKAKITGRIEVLELNKDKYIIEEQDTLNERIIDELENYHLPAGELDYQEQFNIVRLLIDRVHVFNDRLEINWNF